MTTVQHSSKKTHPLYTAVLKSASIVRHRTLEKFTCPVIQCYIKKGKEGLNHYIYHVFQTLPKGHCDSYQNMTLKSHNPEICWRAKYLLYSGMEYTKVRPLKNLQIDPFSPNTVVYEHEEDNHLLAISSNFEFRSTEIYMDEKTRTVHLSGFMQDAYCWYMPVKTQWIIQPVNDYIFELHDIGLYNVYMITLDSKPDLDDCVYSAGINSIFNIDGKEVNDRIMVDNPKSITIDSSSVAIITIHRTLT